MEEKINENEISLITFVTKNVPGVLSKLCTEFANNKLNIEKMIVSNFKLDNQLQKMIFVISGNRIKVNESLQKIKNSNMDFVVYMNNFQSNSYIERELLLVKIREDNPKINDIMDLINEYNGQTILFKNKIVIIQFINNEDKTNELMKAIENMNTQLEVLKSGLIATSLDDDFHNNF